METPTQTPRRMNTFTFRVPAGSQSAFLRTMAKNMGWEQIPNRNIGRKTTVRRPKAKTTDPTCMTKEEYFAMLDQRIAQAEEDRKQGRLITMGENETGEEFINRLLCM